MVWIVNQYAGSPVHGMEYRHYYLGRELVARGYTVVVLAGSYSHLHTHPPDIDGRVATQEIDGLRYLWIRTPRYGRALSAGRALNMAVFAVRLAALRTRGLPRPDAILVSSPSPFPIVPAARWARRWGARLVFEVRDIWPLTLRLLGGLGRRHPLVVLMQWLEDYAYRVSHAVVSVLPGATSHMESRGMDPRKFRYVPNGMEIGAPSTDDPVPEPVADAIRPGHFTVGFVGTLGSANALEPLIDAARLLAGDAVRVVIVGHGPEHDRLVARADGLDNVAFAGAVAKAQIPAVLQRFDACYVGYRRNPLYRYGISPNKLYDYMAAGRPVVLAADAYNRPVEEAGCGITVPPEDPAALAAGIRRMASTPLPVRAAWGANGRAYVVARHDYAVLAEDLAAILLADRG